MTDLIKVLVIIILFPIAAVTCATCAGTCMVIGEMDQAGLAHNTRGTYET